MDSETELPVIRDLPVGLDRDVFLRTLLRELSGTLQEVIGLEEASGFVSVVGQRIGDQIDSEYKAALGVTSLNGRARRACRRGEATRALQATIDSRSRQQRRCARTSGRSEAECRYETCRSPEE